MHRLRRGNVPRFDRGEHQRVRKLRSRPIPSGNGVNCLHRMRCRHLCIIDGIHGLVCVCRMLFGHLPGHHRLDFVRRM